VRVLLLLFNPEQNIASSARNLTKFHIALKRNIVLRHQSPDETPNLPETGK